MNPKQEKTYDQLLQKIKELHEECGLSGYVYLITEQCPELGIYLCQLDAVHNLVKPSKSLFDPDVEIEFLPFPNPECNEKLEDKLEITERILKAMLQAAEYQQTKAKQWLAKFEEYRKIASQSENYQAFLRIREQQILKNLET